MSRWRRPRPAAEVTESLVLVPGERVLAFAPEQDGSVLVATTHSLYAVPAGAARHTVQGRPWHVVDAGRWEAERETLVVSWVDDAAPARWRLTEPGDLPIVLRDRVQASVVLAADVALPGRSWARVAVRRDRHDDRLVAQQILGPGVRADDPLVAERVAAALADLCEQAGLEP